MFFSSHSNHCDNFQKLKDAERERINKLEELENKANVQLERQLVLASDWSRALLAMQGKLKGTEWDPENSHRIDYSEFWRLLNSNNVQFMEYSNYGQTISGWKFILSRLFFFCISLLLILLFLIAQWMELRIHSMRCWKEIHVGV